MYESVVNLAHGHAAARSINLQAVWSSCEILEESKNRLFCGHLLWNRYSTPGKRAVDDSDHDR